MPDPARRVAAAAEGAPLPMECEVEPTMTDS
jgi:hypothetical protein